MNNGSCIRIFTVAEAATAGGILAQKLAMVAPKMHVTVLRYKMMQ